LITKEQLLAIATELKLLPTTINKDYALSWLLVGIGQHPSLSKWVFKGGTCLKKAYFDTYRFSEDLDFTIPQNEAYSQEVILGAVRETAENIYDLSGIEFVKDKIQVTPSINKNGKETFVVKLPFQGPLPLNNKSIQRIKFDITQDETLVAKPEMRPIFHGYSDAPTPSAEVLCYTVNEIIAEKSRALYERQGRARDVYDVVNISHNFREEINTEEARKILAEKFAFKDLPIPTVELILSQIDHDLLKQNWNQQLKHQLPVLPPVDSFIDDLEEALRWWVEDIAATQLTPAPCLRKNEKTVARERFFIPYEMEHIHLQNSSSQLNQIRFAARNRLCVLIQYKGITRLAEPYSLRIPGIGNLLLYVYELKKGSEQGGGTKAFKVSDIQNITVTETPYQPRFSIEL